MRDTNRQLLLSAARLLRPLLEELVFAGGCATGLLMADAAAPSVRATLDVDAIAEITSSRDQMRRHDADEVARCDRLGLLPELREMPLVAGHQVIGAGGIGALQELVVAGVLRGVQRARRLDNLRMVLDELQELQAEALADSQLRARQHFTVFRENRVGDVQPGRFGDRKQKDGAL